MLCTIAFNGGNCTTGYLAHKVILPCIINDMQSLFFSDVLMIIRFSANVQTKDF